ncbi:uncharacterized protein BYT42DRAFT_556703 [Radiomyces spectabilis]|uniref:uncharacterized protein n=1 Tax=Radiomyces spectabilis TaxID=64574 RepID=UPI00221F9F9A|nr:uncharacterized protein BYT42DRAFT_556703 [Radiomyces spectabilis]KAI8391386.1 hypothetical protein BYT42DRAFT_556703 [Radiomyces spectabilis]
MLNKCCLCIDLRTATLLLAILGAFTHLYGGLMLTAISDEFDSEDFGAVFSLTVYSFLSGIACIVGAVGVFKNDVKRLRIFSAYYWADLVLHTVFAVASAVLLFSLDSEVCSELASEAEEPFDMELCESVYVKSAWVVVLTMAINMLLKLHYAFAIRAYTVRVQQQDQSDVAVVGIVAAPPAYTPVPAMEKDQPIYVAGQEYIPDEKKQSIV